MPTNNLRTLSTEKVHPLLTVTLKRRLLRSMLRGLGAVAGISMLAGVAGSAIAQGTPITTGDTPENLTPPASAVIVFELGARGVQIYTCGAKTDDPNAFVWTFKAPEAELFNQRGEMVGSHFGGPTWLGNDGNSVVGAVLERADSPTQGSIPWLLLEANDHSGSGVFSTITYVQRLDTVGGSAPAEGCDADHAGEETRQPYEATYAYYYPAASATPVIATPAA